MSHFTILNLFTLLCGITLFLYGMLQGEKNLKKLGLVRLRQIIGAITKHRLAAYLTGFITTLVTQSSSATTVMLVGFASVQLMTLQQSLGVILGSDLASSMTVQLFALKFYIIAPLLITVGFILSFAEKSNRITLAGKLIFAAGFVFYGMSLMADASGPLSSYPAARRLLLESFTDPWIGLAAGTILTAIIQSSAATLAILIVLAGNFTFPDHSAPGLVHFFPVVLGANIGTCATAFLAILKAETEGIRVAWAHLSFKTAGTLLALPFLLVLPHVKFAAAWPIPYQIAALHTAFNLFLAVVFLPVLPLFDRAIRGMVASRKKIGKGFETQYLHEKVLQFPVLAISQAVKEISRMSDIVTQMVEDSLELIKSYDFSASSRIAGKDDEVDFLHEQVMTFLTHIAREELGPDEASRAYELIMVTTDIEHIGDIVSKSIITFAEKIDQSPTPLSQEGRQEIVDFFNTAIGLLREAFAAFTISDIELARKIYGRKEAVKDRFSSYVDRHMDRLYHRKTESLQTTSIHIDLLEEIQRINHFTFRIAAHVLKIYRAE
ncbi:MAG: Na/Pi cotransporter family protein [Chitinispirillaceae bacterium]|jgi:phosphate:Na+ symporter